MGKTVRGLFLDSETGESLSETLGFFGAARQSDRHDHQTFKATIGPIIPARETPHLVEQAAEERAARPAPKSVCSHRHNKNRSTTLAPLGKIRPADENFGRGI